MHFKKINKLLGHLRKDRIGYLDLENQTLNTQWDLLMKIGHQKIY